MELTFETFPPFQAFYIISLRFCTESALRSATHLSRALNEHGRSKEDLPPQPLLDEAQNVANQGAAISRFFWPSSKQYSRRGELLRAAFQIDDASPLKDRTLRNMVEHYDEYLDDFLKSCLAGQFVPDYFGPKRRGDRGPLKLFRAFFTNTGEFEILGRAFALPPIIDEILKLHKKLEAAQESGFRFPSGASNIQAEPRDRCEPPE